MSLAKYYFPQIFGFKKKKKMPKCGVYHIQTQIAVDVKSNKK